MNFMNTTTNGSIPVIIDPLLNITTVIVNATIANITVNSTMVNQTISNVSQPINDTMAGASRLLGDIFTNVTQLMNASSSNSLTNTSIVQKSNFTMTNRTQAATAKNTAVENATQGVVNFLIGFINTIFIEIFDFLYSLAATYFVDKENHKFLDSYEKSYVFKMFIFKFINTNISIFYTAFILNRNDKNKFDNLYYMLLAMAGTKSVKIFFLKNMRKILEFRLFRCLYFRKVRKEGLK
jgi:Calcium-activated chloride channel